MNKIPFLLLLFLTISFPSCQEKHPGLTEDGVYAEFKTNKGSFTAKLYDQAAPLTVANFVDLAEGKNDLAENQYQGKPFYDGLIFHRVIKDFMIQGGDPQGTGMGGPGYKFPDEIADDLQFDRKGLLAMANSGPATNGSQFFITLEETPWLTGRHTIFGEIVKGQEVVDAIGTVETGDRDQPVSEVKIEKVSIITIGDRKLPSFSEKLKEVEQKRKEKEAELAKKAEEKAAGFAGLKEKATELSSGLKIYVNQEGTGSRPETGSKVLMNYAGYLTDGSLFDSNILEVAEQYGMVDEQRKQAGQYGPVAVDYSPDVGLIPGFREGLLTMKIGEKTTLFIPAHLAYGANGVGNIIPPNSDLIFELELVDFAE